MSVIAWDGKTLAADKRCGTNYPRSVTKIRRTQAGELIGVTGWIDRGILLMDWYEAGADRSLLPDWQKDEDKSCELIVIRRDRSCWIIGEFGTPWRVEEPSHACGSGRDFAAAAMHLGMSAREAVRLACELHAACGNGIDVLTLDGEN
jgi:ATP-dependent protease HslVU (ClpYQ) peptidase subunit